MIFIVFSAKFVQGILEKKDRSYAFNAVLPKLDMLKYRISRNFSGDF
jgi:hypothetical protein